MDHQNSHTGAIRRHIDIAWTTVACSWKQAMAWRMSMVMSVLIDPIILTAYVFIWRSLFAATGGGTIGGYSFNDMVAYYLISALTFHLIWDDIEVDISDAVQDGSMIRHLLRPYPFFWSSLFNKIGHRFLALLIECVPVTLIAYLFFDLDLTMYSPNLGWYFLSLAISFVMIYALRFTIGCAAFWTGRSYGISRLSTFLIYIMSGGFFPLSLLPPALQKILFFLPFQFVQFVPLQAFLGHYALGGISLPIWQVVLLQAAYLPIIIGLALLSWRIGVKRFSGAGT